MTHHRPVWAPDDVDIERPSAARMYDYYLGGSHNFAADRELAQAAIQAWPETPHMCRANRAFLRRAVTLLAEHGVDQFLDLGSGIPTVGNVHEIVQAVNPGARTAYVDSDPVAYAHGIALLQNVPNAIFLQADLRDPESVLAPALTGFLDLSRPVAVLMLMTLHFVPEQDDPNGIVAAYRDATVPGSYLVLSHGTNEYRPQDTGGITAVYSQASHGIVPRNRARITELTAGYDLLDPGVVDVFRWRPEPLVLPDPLDGDPARYSTLAAVGRRP